VIVRVPTQTPTIATPADLAHQNWQLAMRYPWLLEVVTHRGVLGPNTIMKCDRDLSAVDGIGLTELEMAAR
jgi:hypothetical protein